MRKLLPFVLISLIWLLIGWVSRGILQSTDGTLSTLPSEQQRLLKAYELLQSRQLILNGPNTSNSSPDLLAKAAISGMLDWSQDKYAVLYGPLATERYLAGFDRAIGVTDIWFDTIDGQWVVTDVPVDSPAKLADIKVGDILIGLDEIHFDQSISGYEIATLLRGPVGSTYELTIQRGDQITKHQVTRKPWNYLANQIMDGNIGYLKVEYFFTNHTEEAIREVMDEFAQQQVHAIILDLRNNGGGSPAVAGKLMGYFREPGALLYIAEFNDGTQRKFTAEGSGQFANAPIALLINHQTWSAGEIAAAAIAEAPSVRLFGTTTSGKGVIQDTVLLDPTHMLHFTIAKWLTPAGKWIHLEGIAPDVNVTDDPATDKDEVLDAAISYVSDALMKE